MYLKLRKIIEEDDDANHELWIRGSNVQNLLVNTYWEAMKERPAQKPELIDHFTPTYLPAYLWY